MIRNDEACFTLSPLKTHRIQNVKQNLDSQLFKQVEAVKSRFQSTESSSEIVFND